MRVALEDRPIATNEPPDGMVKVSVAANGTLIPDGGGGITEYVKVEDLERMQNYTDYSDEAAPDEEAFDIFCDLSTAPCEASPAARGRQHPAWCGRRRRPPRRMW